MVTVTFVHKSRAPSPNTPRPQDTPEGSTAVSTFKHSSEQRVTLDISKSKDSQRETKAATKLQAWWRGALVCRTLLHAALRACVIQRWWRQVLARMLHRKRRVVLMNYAIRERAAVKLQSLVRMWRVHWRYCQVLSAIYIIRCHWHHHDCQTCALLRGHCVVTATHLQFHIEITSP
ncbi:IQ domain-containing protein F2-like [Glossophaga mutica]